MSLHPTMKRRLHERLHPLIGEEEADVLLDEISPADPITKEWLRGELDDRFARVDERFEHADRCVDLKLEGVEHRLRGEIHQSEGRMHTALRQQTHWVYGAAGFFAVVISIVDRIWG